VSELPTGTVTFVFTDLEGSTRLWETEPDAMRVALARHDDIVRSHVEANAGHVVKTTGDGVLAAFGRAPAATLAAIEIQRALDAEDWPTSVPLRARMAVHTGEAEVVDGDYHGPPLNRAARLMSVAHGGQVLLSRATHSLASALLPPDVEVVDLGELTLRDLSRPERVFQVIGDGLSDRIGTLRTVDAFPGNLPVQVTSFVGRAHDIELIEETFTDRRLVTITGVGGVGKTRLALQVAAELLPRFPDGAWFCELASAADAEEMFGVVAATMLIKPRSGVTLEEAVLESLREKAVLVVLDNCEHLLSAVAGFVDAMLHRCPGVQVLITSREGLGIDGEQVWPLRSLDVPEDGTDVVLAGRTAAVELFVDRARAARPDFTLRETNLASVVEICRRLDGIPLALELASARVAAMSPSDIARHLDERFRLLTGGRRTAVERHQTLRATVDWSYSLLAPTERSVFDRLGVFVGSFDAAAAATVVHGDDVEQWDVQAALIALVSKSLVVAEHTDDDETRYQMLETLRQYAREQLDTAGTTDVWRRRHAQHYSDFAELAGPAMLGVDELRWRQKVGLELDNLRAAVMWGLDSQDPDDADLAIRIIAALAIEGTMRRTSGLAHWAELALPRLEQTTPGRRAAVLGTAGFGATFRGDFDTARELGERSLQEDITVDFPAPNQGVVVLCLTLLHQGKPRAAVDLALAYAEQFDELGLRVFDRCNIRTTTAIWAMYADDRETVKREATRAYELAQRTGNPSSTAMAAFVLGWALDSEDPRASLDHLERSVALTRAGASDVVLANALSCLAVQRARRGERDQAIDALREAIRHTRDGGDVPNVVGALDDAIVVAAHLEAPLLGAILAGALLESPLALFVVSTRDEDEERQRSIDQIRQALGPTSYDAAFRRGVEMPYEALVAFVLAELDALAFGGGPTGSTAPSI